MAFADGAVPGFDLRSEIQIQFPEMSPPLIAMAHQVDLHEMENVMEKKVNLLGILGIVVLLAISTMGSVNYQRARSTDSGLLAPVLACLPGSFTNNFRTPQIWANRVIPPVDVSARLENPAPVCLPGESDANFRLAHVWHGYYIPSVDVTAVITRPFMWNSGH